MSAKYNFTNYKEYIDNQITATNKKFKKTWVADETIFEISKYITEHIPGYKSGICHGVRNGYEVQKFEELLSCTVVGTDLYEKAKDIKNVFVWDFNKENKDFINSFDFVYSNSFDHSFYQEETLKIWSKQIKSKGVLFLEWSDGHDYSDSIDMSVDCFLANFNEYIEILKNDFIIMDILDISNISNRSYKNCKIICCSPKTSR